ncbi:hypothetical protein C8R44DRAFT_602707 [Mycena epipterygia]|nr:hypothetical protein C8R44DRAFT_602707 [Mycena epipterygia]
MFLTVCYCSSVRRSSPVISTPERLSLRVCSAFHHIACPHPNLHQTHNAFTPQPSRNVSVFLLHMILHNWCN